MPLKTTSDNVTYFYNTGSGVATVTNSPSPSATGAITILFSFVENTVTYIVTTISSNALWNCTGLTSVTIPDSVTSIEGNFVKNCPSLTSIIVDATNPNFTSQNGILFNKTFTRLIAFPGTFVGSYNLPDTVTTIDESVFYNISGLTSIVVASANNAFASQDGILFNKAVTTLIVCPPGIVNIGSYILPLTVTTIDENAFYGCSSLTSINIHRNLTNFNSYALRNTPNLESIVIDPLNTQYSSQGGVLGFIGDIRYTVVEKCPEKFVGAVVIPNIYKQVMHSAFNGCALLTSVTIPAAVNWIGNNAFDNCTLLKSVLFLGNIPSMQSIVNNFTVSGDTAYYVVDLANNINTNESSVLTKLSMFTFKVAVQPGYAFSSGPTYIHQNFYLTEEFDVSANGVTAATFDAAATTDVSGNYPNKAEIRVEKSVIQNMFQYWTDAIDMSNAVVSDIFYRVSYTNSVTPLSPDFVVGAIMTHSDPNMNPDSNLTNYLPQDYLRYLAKQLFNTTRGVDLFANETEVLQSVNTRCRVGLNQIFLTYLDANANGIIRDEDDFIILNPYDPVEVAGSQKVTGNPAKKIMKQILQNDPARFVDISSNYAVAGQTYWYKMPIEVGDNLYFPVTIKAPTDQQKLTQPDSTTLIGDRTYLIRCVVVADGIIPSPYNVYSYSALPSLTESYH